MLNLGQLQQHVQHNCHISDARHAGNYTLCTFLLKMREYYRWEHDIPLSGVIPKDDIGAWLAAREQSWQSIEEDDYLPILLPDAGTDPFDDASINNSLLEHGYVYSSGIGIFNKPHFFLGQLLRHEQHEGVNIYVSSCEYARDLVAPPAMSRDDTVYVRMESLRRSIWEKIEEWHWNRDHDTPLYHAALSYGVDLLGEAVAADRIEQLLDAMTYDQIDTVIQHELGEIRAGRFLGGGWKDMVLSLTGNKAELVARAIRDHLADCLITLPEMLMENRHGRIHYYFANLVGVRRVLWPELHAAYREWQLTSSMDALCVQIERGLDDWRVQAERLLELHTRSPQSVIDYIEEEFSAALSR